VRHKTHGMMTGRELEADPPRGADSSPILGAERSVCDGRSEDLAGRASIFPAANMWEQAFLANLTHNVSFVEPWANLVVPALISKTRDAGPHQGRQD